MELKEQKIERQGSQLLSRCLTALSFLCLYTVFFGCLSSMGGLSTLGFPALLPGAALMTVLLLFPANLKLRASVAVISFLTGVLFLLFYPKTLYGAALFCNRLFSASEELQPYRYEAFSVPQATLDSIPAFMLPAGLWIGTMFSLAAPKHLWLTAAAFALLFLFMAWLGLTPAPAWLYLAAASLLACLAVLLPGRPVFVRVIFFAAALLLMFTVTFAFPGKHEALSSWEQHARDRLAYRTVSYDDQKEELPDPSELPEPTKPFQEQQPLPEEETAFILHKPFWVVLLSVFILLLLFVPSVWADRLKKRRADNRAGLKDENPRVRTKAGFLYALRWLREAGFTLENRPFSDYYPALQRISPELAENYAAVLPIWQAAAYSQHSIEDAQANQMDLFLEKTMNFALSRMNKRQRLTTEYFHAL